MLRNQVSQNLKDAMRAKDPHAVSTLRLITAAIKDRDIAARSDGITDGVSDDEIMQLMQKMIKQRQESIRMYEEGGVIAEIGASSMKDMGPLMAALRERYAGVMDFGRASAVAKSRLN